MKKYLFILAFASLIFTGCFSKKVDSPNEIYIDGETITYGENVDKIKTDKIDIRTVFDDGYLGWQEKPDAVYINDENKIRCFCITTENVDVYGDISVGDSVKKIEKNFKYEFTPFDDNIFYVAFDKEAEINTHDFDIDDFHDDFLEFFFYIDDGKIEAILISDFMFGNTFH